MTVHIEPMPEWARKVSPRLWPNYAPVFPDGPPTPDDIAEARLLYERLDPLSQRFYARLRPLLGLPPTEEEPRWTPPR